MSLPGMDNRDGRIWFNGKLIPWRQARVHMLTHALHYGSAVFEGEQVYGGEVFKLTRHSQRLLDSGDVLGFDIPYNVKELDAATQEVVAANHIGNGYVRPLAWRGSEKISVSAPDSSIHVAIAAWDTLPPYRDESRLQGIRMCTSKWVRPAPNVAPFTAKASGLYVTSTLAKHAAEANGYDDALMLDFRGQVAEATLANIFLVMDGELHTPIPDCFLNGITRQTVIELARDAGITVVERAIMPTEFKHASEVFVTGTAAEIQPVKAIDDYQFQCGATTSNIMRAYDGLIGR